MPTLAEINRQIEACPHRYIMGTKKEIRTLPQIMNKNEIIRAITSGMMKNATWLAVCTNQRIIFLNRGMLFGVRQVQVPLDSVQSIDHSAAVFFGTISVWDGASVFSINMVAKKSILPFVRAAEEAMYALRQSRSQTSSSSPAAPDVASQIAKLAELKEKGHITDAEFQAQKKKLLG